MTSEFDLAELISRGGIFYDIKGTTPEAVLHNAGQQINLPSYITPEVFAKAVIEREEMVSTAFGHGIAVPHPRTPMIQSPEDARVCVCFLENPVDFEAIDGEPVFVLFIVLSADTRSHLHILSECSYLFQQERFRAKLQEKPDTAELVTLFSSIK